MTRSPVLDPPRATTTSARPGRHLWSSPVGPHWRLAGLGLTAALIYLVAFTLPYSIPGGLAKPLLQFSRITGPSLGPSVGYVAAIALLFALYGLALRVASRTRPGRGSLAIIVGLGGVMALSLVPMYPVFSLDVFYYMSADRIWSVYRENPFVVPPLQAAHDPFFPYTSWGHYPLPYGPLWPWVTWITGSFGGGLIGPTLLAFKLLGFVAYLACLPAVLFALTRFRPERRLLGLCVFAWNPLILIEFVGGAHNDAVAMIPAAVALAFWVRRESISAAVFITLSFLIKATISVAAPALLWPSLRRSLQARRVSWWFIAHVGVAVLLGVLAWAPFLSDRGSGVLQEADQYFQSITAVVMAGVPQPWRPVILRLLQLVLAAIFVTYCVRQRQALQVEGAKSLEAVWRITVLYFLVVSPFFSGWYMVWPVLLASILAERRITLLTTLLCLGSLSAYFVQFVIRPLIVPTIGWAQINALGMLAAFGPFLFGWWWLNAGPRRLVLALAALRR